MPVTDAGGGPSPSRRALASGAIEVVTLDDDITGLLLGPAAVAARADGGGLRWWASAPLISGARRLGVIGFGFAASRASAEELLPTMRVIADRVARGLANDSLLAELERTTMRLERVLGALSEAVTVNDADGRVVYANQAAAELIGVESPHELTTAAAGSIAARYRITLEDGSPLPAERLPGRQVLAGKATEPLLVRSIELATGRERWCTVRARLLDSEERLAVNVFRDVTDVVIADRRLRFLADAGKVLGSSLELGETLEQVAQLAVPALADWCAVDLWDGEGRVERAALAHIDQEKVTLGRELQERYPPDLDGEGGMGQVLRGGVPLLYPEITDEMLREAARDEHHLQVLRDVGMRSAIVVPMRARGRVIGALSLIAAETGRAFDETDLDFAIDAGSRFAQAVDNARLFADSRTIDA
jgi:GAF domain-containing protein